MLAQEKQQHPKRDHWFIHDRVEGNYVRIKTDYWERFMEQTGIHEAQRLYLTMPGSVSIIYT